MLYKLKTFIRNVWLFRKELAEFQPWDSSFNYALLGRSFELSGYCHKNHGHLVRSELTAQELHIAATLCKRIVEDEYYDMYFDFDLTKPFGQMSSVKSNIPKRVEFTNKRQQDVDYLCHLIKRKSLHWWD